MPQLARFKVSHLKRVSRALDALSTRMQASNVLICMQVRQRQAARQTQAQEEAGSPTDSSFALSQLSAVQLPSSHLLVQVRQRQAARQTQAQEEDRVAHELQRQAAEHMRRAKALQKLHEQNAELRELQSGILAAQVGSSAAKEHHALHWSAQDALAPVHCLRLRLLLQGIWIKGLRVRCLVEVVRAVSRARVGKAMIKQCT